MFFSSFFISYYVHSNEHSFPTLERCTTNNGGCEQRCKIENDKVQCDCYAGYGLAENGRNCSGVLNQNKLNSCHAKEKKHKKLNVIEKHFLLFYIKAQLKLQKIVLLESFLNNN